MKQDSKDACILLVLGFKVFRNFQESDAMLLSDAWKKGQGDPSNL